MLNVSQCFTSHEALLNMPHCAAPPKVLTNAAERCRLHRMHSLGEMCTLSFRNLAASSTSFLRTCAEISSGEKSFFAFDDLILTAPDESTSMYGTCVDSPFTSAIFLPMNRFTEKNVFSGLTTPCRLAICKATVAMATLSNANATCHWRYCQVSMNHRIVCITLCSPVQLSDPHSW